MVSERKVLAMSEEKRHIFAENLRKYMDLNQESQHDLSKSLGYSQATVSLWLSGGRTPSLGTIDKLCRHYGISRSDLLEDDLAEEDPYFFDKDTQKIAQEIFESKEMRGLFYAARDLEPEKLRILQQLCKQLKGTT